ncbi:hypothetical protein BOTNAR_0055g00280 [Botryotinia narcissicola]|uniref:FAD-binding PCMH-type domain-containing protein n=1 Tax=Botryotinia narcissicola TaxID=278944 RepID=A0A4Z1IZG6_9HELO|nr:hypothetical protein BOTNAR_0055g00280 [Botryotinia narcissicola]
MASLGWTRTAATKFGLAVDEVLEWQVVTGVGTLVTATPTQNSDLLWALSGGGGGTYGIVLALQIVWTIGPGFSLVSPVTGLDVAQDTIDSLFSPVLSALDKAEIPQA